MNNLKPTHIIKDVSKEDAFYGEKDHIIGKQVCAIRSYPCQLNGRYMSGSYYILDVNKDHFGRDCDSNGNVFAVFYQVVLESI